MVLENLQHRLGLLQVTADLGDVEDQVIGSSDLLSEVLWFLL